MSHRVDFKVVQITFANRCYRFVWSCAYIFFFRFSPRFLHGWRNVLLRFFGASIGKGVHVYPSARIWAPYNLIMGDFASMDDFVDCYCVDKVEIAPYAKISRYSYLCTASHDYKNKNRSLLTAPIYIGKNTWITSDVFIAPGVFIGQESVILSRVTITKNVPDFTIVSLKQDLHFKKNHGTRK